MNTFENEQIVVATKKQLTGCGLTIIHEGAIVMVADNEPDSYDQIKVWKSIERKQSDRTTRVNPDSLRIATEKEIECFLSGIRNVNMQMENDD